VPDIRVRAGAYFALTSGTPDPFAQALPGYELFQALLPPAA